MRTVLKKRMDKPPVTTMRITKDECRLFAILLAEMKSDNIYDTPTFRISNLSKDDYFHAMDKMQCKFSQAGNDDRRNSERAKSNDFTDLMARLTYKYK